MKRRKLFILVLIVCVSLMAGACKDTADAPSHMPEEKQLNEGESDMDFGELDKVKITGIDIASLDKEQQEILYHQARYCQAMVDADTDTMSELVSEDKTYTHMSGKTQTRDEYFADVENGSLDYHTVGIENPEIKVDGDKATITYTSVLYANAYGASGTFRMKGTHNYTRTDGVWKED